MIEIAHQQYKVFIYTDHQYTVESADNLRRYNRVYVDDSCDRYSNVSNVAILVKHGHDEVASAILCHTGVFTGLSESSFIIEERVLFCFGVFTQENKQVGFARVITDFAVFAWPLDVFILEDHQGKGLGKKLMQKIMSNK